MARYIMANRRAGLFSTDAKLRSRAALDVSYAMEFAATSNLVNEFSGRSETSRRTLVLDIDPAEVAAKKKQLPPQVMIEPEILHYTESALPLDLAALRRASRAKDLIPGTGTTVSYKVRGSGEVLVGAEVELFLRGSSGLSKEIKGVTDAAGEVTFEISTFWHVAALVVAPVGGYWRHLVRGPRNGQTVTLRRLPNTGRTAWWHRLHGVNNFSAERGATVKVGVIDTGLGAHPNLSHARDQGAFIAGGFDAAAGADVGAHGTHVAGIIGARPAARDEIAGIAPGVELFTARVFPPDAGANQGDIANALDHLSSVNECDLVNLSLGSAESSAIEHDSIIDALERGTLCVCAAGNHGTEPVSFPAGFSETLAITAIGLDGWAPDGSLAALHFPEDPLKFGDDGYFLASFSGFGDAVSAAGAGVGIISTVPPRHGYAAPYAVMDGTSMASPAACAALAAMLSTQGDYLAMPRNIMRAQHARSLLRLHARDLGLDAVFQGHGVPLAN